MGGVARSYQDPEALAAWRSSLDGDRRGYDDLAEATTLDEIAMALTGSLGNNKRPRQPYAQIPAFFACVRAIAEAVKHMPFNVATRDDELVESGDVIDLINCPFPNMTGEDWFDATITYMMTLGCYWRAHDVSGTQPFRKIEPVSGDLVTPRYDVRSGELIRYDIKNYDGTSDQVEPHLVEPVIVPNIYSRGLFDPLKPAEPAGHALAQLYGADRANLTVLDNGGEPGVVFEMGAEPDETVKDDFKRQVTKRWRTTENRNLPMVLWGNASLKELARKFSDMEFSKLKSMSIVDVCAVCRTPPSVIGYYQDSNKAHDSSARAGWLENTVLPLADSLSRKLTLFALSTYQARSSSRIGRSYIGREQRKLNDLVSPTYTKARGWARRQRVMVQGMTLGKAGKSPQELAFFGYFDSTNVSEVQETMLTRVERGLKLKELGATLADIVEAFDLPIPADHPWQQQAYRPMSEVPYDEQLPGLDDGDGSVPDPDATDETVEPKPTDPAPAPGDDDAQKSAEVTRRGLADVWQLWRNSWAPLEEQVRGKVSKVHNNLFSQMLKRVEQLADQIDALTADKSLAGRAAALTRNLDTHETGERATCWKLYPDARVERLALADELRADAQGLLGKIIFDLFPADRTLVAQTSRIMQASVALGGEQSIDEHGTATGTPDDDLPQFVIDQPAVRDAMRTRAIKLKGANRTLRNRVRRTLVQGLANGETHAQIAARLRRERGIAIRQAKTIAMTETGAAVESGRAAGREQMGVPLKSWLWSQRETARAWHQQTSQRTVATPIRNSEKFVLAVTGAEAMHPRAAGLPALEVVNCGCTVIGRYPGDSVKSVTTRYRQRGFVGTDHPRFNPHRKHTTEANHA